jgi:hypothetical protein
VLKKKHIIVGSAIAFVSTLLVFSASISMYGQSGNEYRLNKGELKQTTGSTPRLFEFEEDQHENKVNPNAAPEKEDLSPQKLPVPDPSETVKLSRLENDM